MTHMKLSSACTIHTWMNIAAQQHEKTKGTNTTNTKGHLKCSSLLKGWHQMCIAFGTLEPGIFCLGKGLVPSVHFCRGTWLNLDTPARDVPKSVLALKRFVELEDAQELEQNPQANCKECLDMSAWIWCIDFLHATRHPQKQNKHKYLCKDRYKPGQSLRRLTLLNNYCTTTHSLGEKMLLKYQYCINGFHIYHEFCTHPTTIASRQLQLFFTTSINVIEGSLNRNFRQYGQLKSRCIAQQ